jgi:hypothetical protein
MKILQIININHKYLKKIIMIKTEEYIGLQILFLLYANIISPNFLNISTCLKILILHLITINNLILYNFFILKLNIIIISNIITHIHISFKSLRMVYFHHQFFSDYIHLFFKKF